MGGTQEKEQKGPGGTDAHSEGRVGQTYGMISFELYFERESIRFADKFSIRGEREVSKMILRSTDLTNMLLSTYSTIFFCSLGSYGTNEINYTIKNFKEN